MPLEAKRYMSKKHTVPVCYRPLTRFILGIRMLGEFRGDDT